MQQHTDSPTLFIDSDSWIQRVHPFTKLSYILLIGVSVYLLSNGWKFDSLLLIINLAIMGSGRRLLNASWKVVWKTILPLILFMVPIHGILHPDNHTLFISLSWLNFYQEGLVFALSTLLKLLTVLVASLLFVFTTHPADLITAVSQTAGSPTLAYLLGSPLLLLPTTRERVSTIQSAQRARGLDTQGDLKKRFCGLLPLVVPLVLGAIIEIEQRSIALEVRGFKSTRPKTCLRIVADSKLQRFTRWMMLAAAMSIVVYRFMR